MKQGHEKRKQMVIESRKRVDSEYAYERHINLELYCHDFEAPLRGT